MASFTGIVAHLIVGRKPEPYLGAVLESIADVSDYAVINDNSGLPRSTNSDVILQSRLGLSGRLALVHSSFVDFAAARNACLDATPPEFSRAWGLFVDADEVHGDELLAMAALLPALSGEIDAVDGYSRHFVGSFSWWTEMQRRQCFFRIAPHRRWSGRIHERLLPLRNRIVLPAVWFHYGHVVTPRAEAEKSRLYAFLGQKFRPPDEAQIQGATAASVWTPLLRHACRFRGEHPPVVMPTIGALTQERRSLFAEVDAIAFRQSAVDRLRNVARQANYRRLIAWRTAQARLRWDWPNGERYSVRTGPRRAPADITLQVDLAIEGRFANRSLRTSR